MKDMLFDKPVCCDSRRCFAKRKDSAGNFRCVILTSVYKDDNCPFNKEVCSVTDGKQYPYVDPSLKLKTK